MEDPLRLLIVEDDEHDAELLQLELQRGGYRVVSRRVDTESDLREALSNEAWDVIISDFAMPSFDGLRAFDVYKATGLDTPFIFVSGALGEERAVEAMRAGARDYLIKGHLARLSVAVRRELAEARNRRTQRAMEEAAHRHQRRLTMAIEASVGAVFEYWDQGSAYFSERWADVLGYEDDELPTREDFWNWIRRKVHAEDASTFDRAFSLFAECESNQFRSTFRAQHKAGRWVDVEICAKRFQPEGAGETPQLVGILRDVSDLRELEDQLRQSQKMEAVGRLAGGIAHDFNNLLTVMLGYTENLIQSTSDNERSNPQLLEIQKAGRRAASLTGQLLAFSRKSVTAPVSLNLNALLREQEKMLWRLIGEDIKLVTKCDPNLGQVLADPTQMAQVILNLAVNARDAMPTGGELTFETKNVTLDAFEANSLGNVAPGSYVHLAVSDSGFGMNEETRARVFEPFFTTKGAGEGTGLGLSTVHGIVNQSRGCISVSSAVGGGTTFDLYFPTTLVAALPAKPEVESNRAPRGDETILLVEDEEAVRDMTRQFLAESGYRVLEARNGPAALEIAARHVGEIDLLLTDVVMPSMSGSQVAEAVLSTRPGVRVLYMSGYNDDAVIRYGITQTKTSFLPKPFTPSQLAGKVRQTLDREKSA